MNQADISNKWALVTGASRGIGRQVALSLADHGCNVVLHSRDTVSTNTLADEIQGKGVKTFQIGTELSDQSQVDHLIAESLRLTGGIDILYNNAAIMTPWRQEWLDFPAQDFRDSFEVNVISLIRLCHGFIPAMKAKGWGRIVNVTSGVANTPQMSAYAASKAAVDKYVQDTADTLLPDGILMNLLDPGWLRTDLGGPNAPNSVESVLPGALVPVLINDGTNGKLFRAQDYAN